MRITPPCLFVAFLLCRHRSVVFGPDAQSGLLSTGSRARAACEPTEVVVATETEVNFTVELPPVKSAQCAATIEIEYTQRDTLVSVEGTIDHQDCAASNGEQRLTVNVRDENRELKTLEFVEAWQRKDDQPVEFKVSYPIGDNVDLVSVRRATCAVRATTFRRNRNDGCLQSIGPE